MRGQVAEAESGGGAVSQREPEVSSLSGGVTHLRKDTAAISSCQLWRHRFAADESILDATIILTDLPLPFPETQLSQLLCSLAA